MARDDGPLEKAPPAPVRPARMFGIKDLFTTINAMGGVVAICLAIDGRPFEAGLAIVIGYLFGDTLDGWIARKLGTSNQFGAEYDTIADHLAHCIAPGAVVYAVYRDLPLGLAPWAAKGLAIGLAGAVMVTASIRHARNIVRPIAVKGIWFGLPRTVLGFLAVAVVNARVTRELPGGWWIAAGIIVASCVTALTYIPYPSHRMARGHFGYVVPFILAFLVLMLAGLVLYPSYVFDVLLVFMLGYSLLSWLALTAAERASFRAVVAQVQAEGRT
jgi:phosphatidylserine synthase